MLVGQMRVNTDFHSKVEVAKYFQTEKKLDIVSIYMLCMGHVGQVCVSLNTQFPYLSRETLKISFIASALKAPILRLSHNHLFFNLTNCRGSKRNQGGARANNLGNKT